MQGTYIPYGGVENFEALPLFLRIGLPVGGAVLIGLCFQWLHHGTRRVGFIHVMERLQYHEGHLPFKNLVAQFFGGAVH